MMNDEPKKYFLFLLHHSSFLLHHLCFCPLLILDHFYRRMARPGFQKGEQRAETDINFAFRARFEMAEIRFDEFEELRRADAEQRRRLANGDEIDLAATLAARQNMRFRLFADDPDVLEFDDDLPLFLNFHNLINVRVARSGAARFPFSANCVKICGDFPHPINATQFYRKSVGVIFRNF
jgi:hypothetical protein